MAKKDSYNASDIQALSAHNHLLKRISLTFGRETGDSETPFSSQKTVAIREITDNAIDEVIGGYADRVRVHYFADKSIEVQDNGRGLPVDIGQDSTGKHVSGIYLTLGVIQSGGKFSTDNKRFSSGLHGVGGSSTQNLASRTDVTVYRDNKKYELSFKNGTAGFFDEPNDPDAKFTPLKDLTYLQVSKDTRPSEEKKKFKTGTTVRLWLNDAVFQSTYPINTLDITERLRGTAFLVPNLHLHVLDEINKIEDPETGELIPRDDYFHFEGGIPDLVKANMSGNILGDMFHFDTETGYIEKNVPVLEKNDQVVNKDIKRILPIHVAFAWQNTFDYQMESYVNTVRTRLGGVHEKAFEKALTDAFSARLKSIQGLMKSDDPELKFEDFSEGLSVVLYVQISEPQFTGQSKEELGGKEAQRAMVKAMTDVFSKFATSSKNTELMRTIGDKVVKAARARSQAQEQKELKRQKNAIESSGEMPEKLVDCEITHDENSELYIAEGDSALSILKAARNGKYQALLPIRGKIISARKQDMKSILANEEVQSIIKCLGAGVGSSFDTSKLRYGRVFIATDADPDGGAIATLILTLFWELFRPMVEEGRLYLMRTPLHVITTKEGKKSRRLYAEDDNERDVIFKELSDKGIKYESQRLKGLGESGSDVMFETGMNPLTRKVSQVIIGDPEEAERMISITMDKETEERKEWIESNPIDEIENLE